MGDIASISDAIDAEQTAQLAACPLNTAAVLIERGVFGKPEARDDGWWASRKIVEATIERWRHEDADANRRNKQSRIRKLERQRQALAAAGALLDADELFGAAVRFKKIGSGVYFLFRGKRIIYIGQSLDVGARIAAHAKDKRFDRWHWIPTSPARLAVVERAYLDKFMPELNKDGVTRLRRRLTQAGPHA